MLERPNFVKSKGSKAAEDSSSQMREGKLTFKAKGFDTSKWTPTPPRRCKVYMCFNVDQWLQNTEEMEAIFPAGRPRSLLTNVNSRPQRQPPNEVLRPRRKLWKEAAN